MRAIFLQPFGLLKTVWRVGEKISDEVACSRVTHATRCVAHSKGLGAENLNPDYLL